MELSGESMELGADSQTDGELGGLKVMVIDDSKTIRRTAETLLKKAGCEVFTATDGFEALAKIADHRPDIIFVSAGQDASSSDPMGRMSVTSDGYRRLTRAMIELASDMSDGRLVVVQEGGYSEIYAPYCTLAIVEELAGVRSGIEEPVNAERASRWPQSQTVGLDARATIDAVKAHHREFWEL